MDFNIGEWLYCKNGMFPNGTIVEENNGKFFVETGFSILELTQKQIEENFTKDSNQ